MHVFVCVDYGSITSMINKLCISFLQRGVFVDDLTERSCRDSKQLFDVFNDGEGMHAYVCILILAV